LTRTSKPAPSGRRSRTRIVSCLESGLSRAESALALFPVADKFLLDVMAAISPPRGQPREAQAPAGRRAKTRPLSSFSFGDHACGVTIRSFDRGVVAMRNPYVFCVITWDPHFLRASLSNCAKFVASIKRGGDEAPCLHHTSLRLRAKSSETRAILLLRCFGAFVA
jgi:hypothetical protein